MNQNSRVIKFPRRGRHADQRREPMTEERRARGRQWIARLRALIGEGRS